jgi:hypothetical protein
MIATIASMVGIGEKSQILKSVEKDSNALNDMIHDFTRLANTSSIPLFCFFEQHKSDAAKAFKPKGAHIWPAYKVASGIAPSGLSTDEMAVSGCHC